MLDGVNQYIVLILPIYCDLVEVPGQKMNYNGYCDTHNNMSLKVARHQHSNCRVLRI